MPARSFTEMFRDAMQHDEFWVEKSILEFTTDIYSEMKRQGISYSDLARILNTSPAYISKIFRGNANFTIQSMVKLARALGCRLHIRVAHEDAAISWFSMPRVSRKGMTGWKPDNYREVICTQRKEVPVDANISSAA